jgi:hypothetical protein
MQGRVVPEAKAMILCGDVLADPENGNLHLMGAFNNIRPRSPSVYPHRHREFCVFLQLSDAQGRLPGYVQVIRADTQELVYRTASQPMIFADRRTLVRVCFRIRNCTFPAPGLYWIEFFANDLFVTDRMVRLFELGE